MPDFGKALKHLKAVRDPHAAFGHPIPSGEGALPDPSRFRRREAPVEGLAIADQLQFLRVRWQKQSMKSTVEVSEPLPSGQIESTPFGSHYVVQTMYPHDYVHGKIRLSRFSGADLESLISLMREKAAVPPRERIVFLDTETTGLQGGSGMCPFLVGIGYFAGDEFHLLQYFIRDFDEEPSMLYTLGELLGRFDLVVTYNGAAFDVPLLETRFTLARLHSPFRGMSHLDLLFTTRRLWRNGHGSCRLAALEREMISFRRGADIPGSMIPRVYFDYIQRRPNVALTSVFTHNVYDVVSLAALTIHACDRVTLEPAPLDDPLDLYSLGRILEYSREWRRSIQLYEMALASGLAEPVRKRTLENLSIVCRRAGDHERSLEICAQLMAYPEFSMTGYEGAAIYYEHGRGDLENAQRVLKEALGRAESQRARTVLKARWDRLQQKVIRYE